MARRSATDSEYARTIFLWHETCQRLVTWLAAMHLPKNNRFWWVGPTAPASVWRRKEGLRLACSMPATSYFLLVSLHIRSMWETICDPTASLLGWLSLSDPFSQWPSILCIHRCRWFTFSEWPSILCIHRCRWFTFSEWPSILCIHRCRLWLKVTYFLYWQLPPVETNI